MQSTELLIVAHGAACLSGDDLTAIRQQSVPRFAARLRPQLLKHSDEQTLAATVALDRAIDHLCQDELLDFSSWGVVSATRYLGRTAFAAVIDKYKIDGPWGVSVQAIPHTSPHALASSLSLALASHAPCLGAASAPGKELQALLTSATLLRRPDVGGVWLVLSGWHGELLENSFDSQPHCHAAVLALVPPKAAYVATTKPSGRVIIEPADAKCGISEPIDLLHELTTVSRGRRLQLFGGGLRVSLELFATGYALPPAEGRGEVTPLCNKVPRLSSAIKLAVNRPQPNPLPVGEPTNRLPLAQCAPTS